MILLFPDEHSSAETRFHFEEFVLAHARRRALDGSVELVRFFVSRLRRPGARQLREAASGKGEDGVQLSLRRNGVAVGSGRVERNSHRRNLEPCERRECSCSDVFFACLASFAVSTIAHERIRVAANDLAKGERCFRVGQHSSDHVIQTQYPRGRGPGAGARPGELGPRTTVHPTRLRPSSRAQQQ